MLSIIFALFLVGLAFVALELLVPGGLLGLLGGLAMTSSWVLTFIYYGVEWGFVAVVVGVVLIAVAIVVELKLLQHTKLGRQFLLDREIQSTSQRAVASPDIVGRECEALTTLAPTGVVALDNRKYEALSMSGFVEKGTRLQVVDFDNFRVRVRKI